MATRLRKASLLHLVSVCLHRSLFTAGENAVDRDGKVDVHFKSLQRVGQAGHAHKDEGVQFLEPWNISWGLASVHGTTRIPRKHRAPASGVKPLVSTSLIQQEVRELEAYVDLCKERLDLLREMRGTLLSGQPLGLSPAQLQVWTAQVPNLADLQSDPSTAPSAAPDDYVVRKAMISHVDPIMAIAPMSLRWRQLKKDEYAHSLFGALLASVDSSGMLLFWTIQGELLFSVRTGHQHRISAFYVDNAPSKEVYYVLTGDESGRVEVRTVKVFDSALKAYDQTSMITEKTESPYLGPPMAMSEELVRDFQISSRVTSLAVGVLAGAHNFLVGDAAGNISRFTKTGPAVSTLKVCDSPIVDLLPWGYSVLYRTSASHWGVWSSADNSVIEFRKTCSNYPWKVRSVAMGEHSRPAWVLTDMGGAIWVFSAESFRTCKANHVFNKTPPTTLAAAPIRGYVIAVEGADVTSRVVAYNLSRSAKRVQDESLSAVVWRLPTRRIKAWTVLHRYGEYALLALLYDTSLQIEVVELTMERYSVVQERSATYMYVYFTIAVILFMWIQYYRSQKEFKGIGDAGKVSDVTDEKELVAEFNRQYRAKYGR